MTKVGDGNASAGPAPSCVDPHPCHPTDGGCFASMCLRPSLQHTFTPSFFSYVSLSFAPHLAIRLQST